MKVQKQRIKSLYDNMMDYRDEVGVILINHGHEAVWIEDGERIAQLVFGWVDSCEWEEVHSLNETDRKGGFGSTGIK